MTLEQMTGEWAVKRIEELCSDRDPFCARRAAVPIRTEDLK